MEDRILEATLKRLAGIEYFISNREATGLEFYTAKGAYIYVERGVDITVHYNNIEIARYPSHSAAYFKMVSLIDEKLVAGHKYIVDEYCNDVL